MSQRELAAAVRVSVEGVHYVLDALIDKGPVKLGNFTAAEDKCRYTYILAPKSAEERLALTRIVLVRKMRENESLKAEIKELSSEIDTNNDFIM